MIEVEIPNNIAEYKTKLLFGLTGKQVACVALTATCIFLDFKFLKPYIGETFAIFLAVIPAFLAAMFGWVEPYGMTFDKYLKSVLLQAFIAPRKRKAKTLSSIVVPCDKNYVGTADEELAGEVFECVQYVRQKNGIVVDTNTTKPKKVKYKKSPQAIL